jgi:DNA anti-recombination protein RmuC
MEETISHSLLEYGVLGIAVVVLGYVVYSQWKSIVRKNTELDARLNDLQTDMRKYLENDKIQLMEMIQHNTQAFRELQELMKEIVKMK